MPPKTKATATTETNDDKEEKPIILSKILQERYYTAKLIMK